MQALHIRPVMRLGVGNVNVQTIAALLHGGQVLPGVNDERSFGQQDAVLVH